MKKLSSSQKIQKRLVENITLLYTLCEVPGKPNENDLHSGHDEGRQLSRDRERQLTDSFAFISATTDDMLRVMAVSIEEDPDKKGMTVRLASNTGDLSEVTQGLNGIARTLEQASLRKNPRIDIQQDLFRQIVTLDEPRILSRLRSIHAEESRKTKGKPELLYLLSRAVHDKSILGRNKTTKAKITKIRSSSKELSEMFSRFETVRWNDSPIGCSRNMLIDLLIRIDGFDVDALQTVLRKSPTINPSTRDYLPQAMSKLGRYYRVACDLIGAARSPEYTIFRRISVRSLEKPQLEMAFIADYSTQFNQVAERFTQKSHQHLLLAHNSALVSAARTKYELRLSNNAIWKVHAEIQLLLFYERNPHVSRPRIIGSSKSACYLCDLFIQVHGEFSTPRTHGRLYDRWMLPEQSISQPAVNERLLSVIDEFNATLEVKINDILRHRTRPFPHPNESVLHLRQPWLSNSTLAETLEQASIQEIMGPTNSIPSRDRTRPPSKASSAEQASIEKIVESTRSNPTRDQTRPLSNTSSCKEAFIQEIVGPTHSSPSRDRTKPQPKSSLDEQASTQGTSSPTHPNSSISQNPPPRNPPPHSPPTPSASTPLTPRPQSISQLHLANPEPSTHQTTQPTTIPRPLPPNTSTTRQILLPPPHSTPLTIPTGSPVILHASWDAANENSRSTSTTSPVTSPRTCYLRIHHSTHETHTMHQKEGENEKEYEVVDIDSIAEDHDTVFESGGALSAKALALRVPGGNDMIVIKYGFFESGEAEGERTGSSSAGVAVSIC